MRPSTSSSKRRPVNRNNNSNNYDDDNDNDEPTVIVIDQKDLLNAEKSLRALLSLLPDMQQTFETDVSTFIDKTAPPNYHDQNPAFDFQQKLVQRIHRDFESLATDLNLLYGDVFLSMKESAVFEEDVEEEETQQNQADGKNTNKKTK